jgi:hypothetical protein
VPDTTEAGAGGVDGIGTMPTDTPSSAARPAIDKPLVVLVMVPPCGVWRRGRASTV